jgi:predicted RNA-binding protein with PIN domain
VLSILQITIWVNPSNWRVYGFGITAQKSNINTDFFDSFRKTNTRTSHTELFFAPLTTTTTTTSKWMDSIESNPSLYHRHISSPLSLSLSFSQRSLLVLMGQKGGSKGDKQKRKPKMSDSASAPSATAPAQFPSPAAAAPRVSTHINVPIRQQIKYGKINKQFREAAETGSAFRRSKKGNFVSVGGPGGAGPVKRSSYRKSLDEETIQQKALERQRKGQNPDWSVVLNQTKADPLVLVDGYNVIYKWSRLKKHMVRGDTDRARQLLLEDLEGLASLQRWRIECVFDGAGRATIQGPLGSGPSNGNDVDLGTNPSLAPFGKTGTVRTVYTGRNTEADTYIEGRCAAAKNVTLGLTTSSLIVATDDSQIKLVANSAGALCMSSDRFVLELKAVKKGMQYRVEKAMSDLNNMPMRPEKQWGTPTGGAKGTTTTERFFQGGDIDNDYRTKPKREILEEKEDGSKLLMARYGANEIIIQDNRNKKPRIKNKSPMGDAPKKKKKKKKKK